ncbi:YSIRK-type signal peptide-containing protein [Limosilactobacillus oris]|uniref:YSIRK-type signal peptide-containing protein n=1 Tax=Limosilactobacillus oris TaxID=1632 RepID=UPI0024B35731|nr:YSIRK-type signal peptide-containing protein [Limosilactobacillus oris]WHO86620.1 YSIRK-type signal peptide-containing protein [Limosilactobacillus oris]
MLSRNNWKEQFRQQEPKKQRFTIKKLTIGVASVLIGFTFMGMSASANGQTLSDTQNTSDTQTKPGTQNTPDTAGKGQDTKASEQGNKQDAQQTVNKWMSTPALDDLKNFKGTPENHVTQPDVTNVVNQINSLKQKEYQKQLDQVKQQVLNEIGKRLDTVTPAQIQAVKDEQDLFQLEGVLQSYSEHQDVIKRQELKNEMSQIKAQGYKDVDAAKTNAEVNAAVKKTLDGLSLVVANNNLWSTRGTLIRSGFLLNSYAYLSNEDKAALQKQITDAQALLAEQTTELDDWKQGDAAAFEQTTKQTQKKAIQILNEIKEEGTKNFAAAQSAAADALAKLPNLHTVSPFAPAVLTAFQKEVKDAKNANTIDILMRMAKKMNLPIPKVEHSGQPEQPQNVEKNNADTTTLIAPSKIVPSYDGTKVVDTPFYNNSRGTNSNLIDNQSKTGQYTFYFTAKDASGKEYASSYAAEKGNPTGVVLNSILDKDAGAYDPNSLEYHFYYQNTTDQDQTINYTLRMADYLAPYKPGSESSLVPDGSRISDVKVISKQGNTYDISSVIKNLDKSEVGDVPVNLTVKANDAINLVIPFVLNTTAKKSTDWIDDHNEFSVRENGQQTGYLVVRSSTYAPLFSEHKIYPLVNVENNNYTHDYPDNPGAFDLDPSVYLDNDFMDGFRDGRTGVYKASKPTNLNTVYNSYTYTFLLLDNYQKSLTKHGFTVAFRNGKPAPYYMYQLSKTGSKVVDKNGNPVQGETKGHPYFEVVPVILLNQDETYTTKTAPTAWDPSTMVNKVADPTNYRYWDQKTDSAVRMDNTAAQLTAKDFTVTITKDGQAVKPDDNGKYDLSKPGTYTVTYSKDFNGTTISNSGQITVTPTNPAKPDNGNKGTDTPVTPSKPTDNKGDQPTTPTKPNTGKDDNKGDQSTTPTNPSKGDDKPTNPTAPTNPSKPNTGKDDNNKGDQPTNPTTPTKPDDNKSNKPVTPTNPAKPDNGNKGTDTPVTPSKPTDNKGDQPTTPTKPNTGKDDNKGDQSTTPTNPSKGDDKPTNPTAPTNPSKPDDNKSNKPVTPTNPAKPDNGNKGTDTPVTPSKPTDNKGDQPTTPTIPAQPDHGNASISGQAGHKPATSDNGTQNGNNNGINNGTQNGNGNKTVNTNVTDNGNGDKTVNTNVTDNGNGDKTVNTNVTDNGNGDKTVNTNVTDNSQNNKQALPQTGNTKNDAAVAGLGLASLLAMLGLGGLKKKRN